MLQKPIAREKEKVLRLDNKEKGCGGTDTASPRGVLGGQQKQRTKLTPRETGLKLSWGCSGFCINGMVARHSFV